VAEETPQSFEQILARLETIAKTLEGGNTKLEDALSLFEEGIRLAGAGNKRLSEAERKLEILVQGDKVQDLDLEKPVSDEGQ
jgi:exodeoxyribonuclease VII small subunit